MKEEIIRIGAETYTITYLDDFEQNQSNIIFGDTVITAIEQQPASSNKYQKCDDDGLCLDSPPTDNECSTILPSSRTQRKWKWTQYTSKPKTKRKMTNNTSEITITSATSQAIIREKKAKRHKFVCTICEKRFLNIHMLNQHSVIHTGEKPFKCKKCNKAFTRLSALTHHKCGSNHWQKIFECHECSKIFKDDYFLKLHKKKYHFGESTATTYTSDNNGGDSLL